VIALTDWKSKKVERFSSQEYKEFWKQYLSEQIRYFCNICNKPIERRHMVSHMEKNHDQKYEQHNRNLDNANESGDDSE